MDSKNSFPEVLSLNPKELIAWCNNRKKEKRLSNAKLAEITGVPEGTIDRIFTGKNLEFRYSTIQPIVSYLIGVSDDTPTEASNEFYVDTIDGYKLVLENKNYIIENLKQKCEQLEREITYLKKNNTEKQEALINQSNHVKWMEKMIEKNSK
ncbi:MAG: hypothetical protein KBT35_07475 [Firmicutes bacterium]|nr:hypothetical protein [Candidatus Colivicinus equi]